MAAKRGRPLAETAASYFAREGLDELKAYAAERGMGVRAMLDKVREFDKLGEHGAFAGHDEEYVYKDGKRKMKHIPSALLSFEEQRLQFEGPRESLEYCLWAVRFMKEMKEKRAAWLAKEAALPGPNQLDADLAQHRKQARSAGRALTKARKDSGRVYTLEDEFEARNRTWDTCHGVVLLIEAAMADQKADDKRPVGERRWSTGDLFGRGSYSDLYRRSRLAVASLKHATDRLERAARWLKHSPPETPYTRGRSFKDT
jgi:hypothetical protein